MHCTSSTKVLPLSAWSVLAYLLNIKLLTDCLQIVRGQGRIVRRNVLKGFAVGNPDLKCAHHDAQLQCIQGSHITYLQSDPPSAGSCRPWCPPARPCAAPACPGDPPPWIPARAALPAGVQTPRFPRASFHALYRLY